MSQSVLNFAFLAAFLVVFSSCAPVTPNSNDNSFGPHYLDPSSSAAAAMEIAKGGHVTCGSDRSDCSPSVGMLATLDTPTVVAQCSAFLVAPNIAMTNSHCIPDDLKATGSSCSDRIWMYFPGLPGFSETRVGCSKILAASALSDAAITEPDYAVIQLDSNVSRPTITISREGFKDQDNYYLVKIDPQSHVYAYGSMIRATCKSLHNNYFAPGSTDDLSPNMMMGDCNVIHGNSGSPILDSQGKARGIIQFTIELTAWNKLDLRQSLPLLDDDFAPLGGGTNLACLALPDLVPASSLSNQCAELSKIRRTDDNSITLETSDLYTRVERSAHDRILKISPQAQSSIFEWTVTKYYSGSGASTDRSTSQPIDEQMVPVPSCIRDPQLLSSASAQLKFNIPLISVRVGMSRFLSPDFRLEDSESRFINAVLAYEPAEFARSREVSFKLSEVNTFGSQELWTRSLKLCATKN